MDPDLDRHFIGPDLGPNCLQRLSADDKRKVSYIITGGTNILDWLIVDDNIRDYYIPCTLSDTDINSEPRVPVYYVSLKVKNGAGDYSPPQVSTPVIVVPEDVTGRCFILQVLYFGFAVFL